MLHFIFETAAFIVQKGNPKKVKADLREMLRKDLVVILGNAESGSVGQEAKAILDRLGIYPQVVRQAAFLAPDSRSLMLAMRKGEADLTMSWRATGFFPENAEKLDVIDLPPTLARPQPLLLNLLKSSRHPELAKRFMAFAAGEEGQAIFRKHGFLDNKALLAR
ncbi:MAG: substrate-binding domain-containing protein [Rhodocyclaceae bacterium]|nr:substrate-binding domain-containing protein [Rhodocyclaceae bacterium]